MDAGHVEGASFQVQCYCFVGASCADYKNVCHTFFNSIPTRQQGRVLGLTPLDCSLSVRGLFCMASETCAMRRILGQLVTYPSDLCPTLALLWGEVIEGESAHTCCMCFEPRDGWKSK